MQPLDIENFLLENFKDINLLNSWGEKSFFINPDLKLKRGTYFATLKEKDGENDKASYLNRSGIFRLNMGVGKDMYLSLFDSLPKRPAKGGVINGPYDFQELDIVMPHPVYGWMGWICVLNPSAKTFKKCKEFLNCAYNKAKQAAIQKILKI